LESVPFYDILKAIIIFTLRNHKKGLAFKDRCPFGIEVPPAGTEIRVEKV
jgi:hypothetical protein